MKPPPSSLDPLAVRRATLVDAGKVRYRVYRTPSECVVVIAESALMAVRAAGVAQPYKIIRDLPTEGPSIPAARMEAVPEQYEKVPFATTAQTPGERIIAELSPQPSQAASMADFKPMALNELKRHEPAPPRILPPELLHEIIKDHVKATLPAREAERAYAEHVEAEAEQTAQSAAAEARAKLESMQPPPPPPPPTRESILSMAEELIPEGTNRPKPPKEDVILSQDEVEKLLNG